MFLIFAYANNLSFLLSRNKLVLYRILLKSSSSLFLSKESLVILLLFFNIISCKSKISRVFYINRKSSFNSSTSILLNNIIRVDISRLTKYTFVYLEKALLFFAINEHLLHFQFLIV